MECGVRGQHLAHAQQPVGQGLKKEPELVPVQHPLIWATRVLEWTWKRDLVLQAIVLVSKSI